MGSAMDSVLLASLILGGAIFVASVTLALALGRVRSRLPSQTQMTSVSPTPPQAITIEAPTTQRDATRTVRPTVQSSEAPRAEAHRADHEGRRRDDALRDAIEALAQRVAQLEQELRSGRPPVGSAPSPSVQTAPHGGVALDASTLSVSPASGGVPAPSVSVSGSIIEPHPRTRRPREELAVDVRRLVARGRNAIEIAQMLDVDVGEVELVMQLDRAALLRDRRLES
ncbi:MAG: hypothetical protein JNL80_00400 [Phycisphaerae bacterium]|jgi:hypothetical protein|nr:hypothetical protein [Phycisphaerae bacterium]